MIYKLFPECKDYVWGGERLKTEYGKVTDKRRAPRVGNCLFIKTA